MVQNLRRLEEVNLEELLEVEVRDIVLILRAEKLGELRIRDDTALEVRVKAVVRLDVRGDELRDIRLGLLGLRRETHERREFIGDRAELEERVLGAALFPRLALFGGERGGVNTATALGVTRLTLERLDRLLRIVDDGAETRRDIRADRTERILETREDVGRGALRRRGDDNFILRGNRRRRGGGRRLAGNLLLRRRGRRGGSDRGRDFGGLLRGHL